MSVDKNQVLSALRAVQTPLGTPLTDADVLSDIAITGGRVFFSINVDASQAPRWAETRSNAEAAVKAIAGVEGAMVALTAEKKSPRTGQPPSAPADQRSSTHTNRAAQGRPPAIPGIAHVIAVASGKGGVGKSTTALNLALSLHALGLRIGLLDADIYGPSVPRLVGASEKPQLNSARKLIPISRFGIVVMSIGFLVDDATALIWRGPMVTSAIRQMLHDVAWGELDVLVVDMPPGTGDAQLTLSQQAPLDGAVIVSTPQDLALIDARRGVAMFDNVGVKTLGIVENMSFFVCPECGTRSDIFGHGGAHDEAKRLNVPFLGEIPLDASIREASDAGRPPVVESPDGPHAKAYRAIAVQLAGALELTIPQV